VGKTFELTVEVEIDPGWHIYDLSGPAPYADTTLALALPAGLEAVGDWKEPESRAYHEGPAIRIWSRKAAFAHEMLVAQAPQAGAEVSATLGYQACNRDLCHPPREVKLTAQLPATGDSWAPHRKLRVLYAGFEGGHREGVFAEFLARHFDHSATIPLAELSLESARGYDVVIADWVSYYGLDGYEKIGGRPRSVPITLRDDFTKPVVAMTYVGTRLRREHKLNWL